jgi:hypothetical protein
MTARVHVAGFLPEFEAGVAGLPRSAATTNDPLGAIVVVDGGDRWWDAATDAVDGGARAVIVADPVDAPVEAIDALATRARIPVLVHRSRLRHDLVSQALEARDGAAPRVLVAECRAEPADLPALVRDAIGWMRALTGAPMEVAATGGAALLRASEGGLPVGSLIATATTAGGPVLRIRALGETTTELEFDESFGRHELSTSTARGRMVSPALHESAARAALRRAIDVVAADGAAAHPARLVELEELRGDAIAVDAIASGWRDPHIFS